MEPIGIVAIVLSIGMSLGFLGVIGYKFFGTFSDKKIEVHATNSNSDKKDD